MDFVDNIFRLTIGIRFDKSFRVLDIAGKIVDTVLNGQNSPFDQDFFPIFLEGQMREKALRNESTNDYLSINDSNLIFSVRVDNDYSEKIIWLKEKVVPFFEKEIFKNHKIQNICRIGFIFHHKLSKFEKLKSYVNQFGDIDQNFEPENINLVFSKKIHAQEADYNKDIKDYRNTIFTFRENKENDLIAEMDFQHFFIPVSADLSECGAEKIVNDAEAYLKNIFYKRLESYVC